MYYEVITQSKSSGIGDGLTYESSEPILVGSLVQVPLRNQLVCAVVIKQVKMPEYETKLIATILAEDILTVQQIQTAQWIASYYCCTLRHALGLFLPGTDWQKLVPEKQTLVCLTANADQVQGKKQLVVVDFLLNNSPIEYINLREATSASKATIDSLVRKGILTLSTVKHSKKALEPVAAIVPQLTTEQKDAVAVITLAAKPTLVFGVTGSGKTEVYCSIIAKVLLQNLQAIVLVPEIFLTEHLVHRYRKYFPDAVIEVVHSKLTEAQRRDIWHRCKRSEVHIVLGSRSALFAPLDNIGCIIIDEEHEWTYKQDTVPRYHAVTVAEYMATLHKAILVLGSATPSIESWHKVQTNSYTIARLPERFTKQALPEVKVIDLVTAEFDDYYPFSKTLLSAIEDRLQKKEQVILFLNRRGLASALLCFDCRRKVTSPVSLLPFTVHERAMNTVLIDHTSNTVVPAPKRCPHCDSENLRTIGAGTQRIEKILTTLFPHVTTLRIDKDTLQSRNSIEDTLEQMQSGKASILLGTQAVVKGLDLPNVTLAGVLVADVGLSLPHFRAGERVFQLLTQLVGRSGRHKPGEVLIQTFRPESLEVKAASTHATEEYLQTEYKMRSHAQYPPCGSMIRYLTRGPNAEKHMKHLTTVAKDLIAKQTLDCTWLSSPTYFGAGKVWHALSRGKDVRTLQQLLPLDGVMVDVDPYETI